MKAHRKANLISRAIKLAQNPYDGLDTLPSESTGGAKVDQALQDLHSRAEQFRSQILPAWAKSSSWLTTEMVTPDMLWRNEYGRAQTTFVVADFNLDGQYEVYTEDGSVAHNRILVELEYKGRVVDPPPTQKDFLPIVTGRTSEMVGKDPDGRPIQLLSFWGERSGLGRYIPYGYPNWVLGGPDYRKIVTDQYLSQTIIPLLIRQGIVGPHTLWWGTDYTFRGEAEGPTKAVPTQKNEPVRTFDFNGRQVTLSDLLGILHSGTAVDRQQVRDLICKSSDSELTRWKDQVACDKPVRQIRQPRVNPIGPGGVEFRSQNSQNRAWQSIMGSRRRRLAVQVAPHIRELKKMLRSRPDPDNVYIDVKNPKYGGFKPTISFILADMDLDGQYEVYTGGPKTIHADILARAFGDAVPPTEDVRNRKTLPIIMGRVGYWYGSWKKKTDAEGTPVPNAQYDVVTFWGPRGDLKWLVPKWYPLGVLDQEITSEFLQQQVLPVLLRNQVVRPDTYWFDADRRFQGKVSRQAPAAPNKAPKKFFNVGGQQMTPAQLAGMLHAGTAEQKQMLADIICRSDDPDLRRLRDRVDCSKPTRRLVPRINPIKPGGVEFRTQRSLNRAWNASRRARLIRAIQTKDLEVPSFMTPDTIYGGEAGTEPEHTIIVADFNHDSQYEVYAVDGRRWHSFTIEDMNLDEMIKKPEDPNFQTLPIVLCRTGTAFYDGPDEPVQVLAFWNRRDLTQSLPWGYPASKQSISNPYIKELILPLLLRERLIEPNTLWWGSDHKFQGRVGDVRMGGPERPSELSDSNEPNQTDQTLTPPTQKKYDLNGKQLTRNELLVLLHTGTADQKQSVRHLICQSDEPELSDPNLRDLVDCQRYRPPARQPRLHPVGPGGVEFRKQQSQNRAWNASKESRMGQKRKVVCIDNGGEHDLTQGRTYVAMRDVKAGRKGLLRVVDDSAEDYLYPRKLFRVIGRSKRK